MSRTKTFASKKAVAAALKTIGTNDEVSRFHKLQLVDAGYLEPVKVPEAKKVIGSRGRMPVRYDLTKAGRNLVQLSKAWFKPAVATEAQAESVTA